MQVRFNTLSEDEQEATHEAALSILEKVGVRIKSVPLFRTLRQAGAPSDECHEVVYFPRQMVFDALAAAPRHWEAMDQLGNRLPGDQPHFVARVLLSLVLEYGQEEPRLPRRQDIVNLCRLADALPKAHIVFKVDCPCSDITEELTYLETIATVYKNTTKHCLANPINPDATRYWVELGEVAAGKPISQQPVVLCGMAATSPLTIDIDTGDSLLFLANRGAPINCFAMPITGASSPITLAGTVVQHAAEVLALITAVQVINPGTPVCYGGMACTMNMRTGGIVLGSPALPLFANALTTMAKYYGLRAYNAATYTDALFPDIQCGVEKALSALAGMAAGSDVGMFGGDLNDAMTISYEQLLIDYDIWETVCRVLRGVLVDPNTLAQEVIERVGHGGAFLTDAHTLFWLRRDEHFFGQLFNRARGPEGRRAMSEKAHQRVEEILDEDKGSPVPCEVVERIDAYVREESELIQRRQK